MKAIKIIFICLFLLGAGIRAIDVSRPFDGSIRECWRECDVAGVARNYYRESMNLFYPRVDWRGDGPGYVEMEFPIFPWFIAVLYKIFGFHEAVGRVLAYILSLFTLLIFFKLSRHLLPDPGAIASSLFFVLSPLAVRISNTLQPEGLMFACYLLAVYAFIRWLDDNSWKYYCASLFATALAILAKANAAHIGLLFLILVLSQRGFSALRQIRIWVFGIFSLLPAALWYAHARHFWLIYGNSLGLSNESHWAGWDLFSNPSFISGIAQAEIFYVWMPTGLIIATFGVLLRRSERVIKFSLYWYSSIFIFYLIAARTMSLSATTYYHVLSVAPAALLIGAGAEEMCRLTPRRYFVLVLIAVSAILALMSGIAGSGFFGHSSKGLIKLFLLFGLFASLLILFLFPHTLGLQRNIMQKEPFLLNTLIFSFLAFVLSATLLFQLRQIRWDIITRGFCQGRYECAQAFSTYIPSNVLLLVSGGWYCKDSEGNLHAVNAPYMFYWLDRKGFNLCMERQSVEDVKSFAKRGARYFIAERYDLSQKPGFESDLRKEFNLIKECKDALLFELPQNNNPQ